MTARFALWALGLLALILSPVGRAQQPDATTTAPAPSQSQNDAYVGILREAYQLIVQGKYDDALAKANAAIQLNPKGMPGYILRGSVYSEKKVYDKSAQDFQMALQIDPNNSTVKFNLAEIKFVQKQYAAARPEFAALMSDKENDLRDLASYKVFLCDLFGGQAGDASKELDAFNQAGSKPSYYFGNAAWDLFNHKTEDARSWLVSASHIYAPEKNSLYASSLTNLGYLPLPTPPAR